MSEIFNSISDLFVEIMSIQELKNEDLNCNDDDKVQAKNQIIEIFNLTKDCCSEGRDLFLKYSKNENPRLTIEKIDQLIASKNENWTNHLTEQDFNHLLAALLDVFDQELYDDAAKMNAYILILFPKYMQPYLLMADLVAQKGEIDAAIRLLTFIVKNNAHPLAYCSAGNFFSKLDNSTLKNEAKRLLTEAKKMIQLPEFSDYSNLLSNIEEDLLFLENN